MSLSVRCVIAAFCCMMAAPLAAQQRQSNQPTPAQLRDLLQTSGMSLPEIRDRLRAQGLSESLLDQYYSGRATGVPDSSVFAAVRALGLATPPDSAPAAPTPTVNDGRARNVAAVQKDFLDTVAALARDATSRLSVLELLRSPARQQAVLDNGNTVFGLSVFQRESSLFDANDAGPVTPDYRLGPGDLLLLILTGDTERAQELVVTREGMIFIPNVGGVSVANLTMRQLEDLLFTRLSRVYSGIRRGPDATAHFQISVTGLASIQVSVLGDVAAPGAYRVSKLGTALTSLYAAGGPTENGSMRQVQVRRAGKSVATIDLYDYLVSGISSNDIRLESGDVVFVPPRGPRIRLAGAVIRPSTYELRSGESLGELLRMAGGFRPEADRRRVQIERYVPPALRGASGTDRVLFDVSGASLEDSREPLNAGDVVRVLSVAQKIANQVVVTGNVWSPGPVALTPGMKVSDAIARAGGIQSDTYLEALQVTRLEADSTRRMIRLKVPESQDSDDNILLAADDSIRVFSLGEYRPGRYVTITGAVRSGGRHAYKEGMTVRDLLMVAGGLQEGALLTEAEVARMPNDRNDGATATTVRVPLDSSYLFDRVAARPYPGPPGVGIPSRTAPEFELRAYDNVLILRQPDFLLPRIVHLVGQVKYPGDYTLISKSERLSDLIQRAGGLTKDAYAEGIAFYRRQENVGRIGIDLPAALGRSNHRDNLLLAEGDSIFIPFYSAVVTVAGAVNSKVSVPFVPGQDLAYYVYAAGGATAKGQQRKSYVMQPSGKVESIRRHFFFITSTPRPQPGSTVTVPERPASYSTFDFVSALAATTSILTSIVALSALIHGKI